MTVTLARQVQVVRQQLKQGLQSPLKTAVPKDLRKSYSSAQLSVRRPGLQPALLRKDFTQGLGTTWGQEVGIRADIHKYPRAGGRSDGPGLAPAAPAPREGTAEGEGQDVRSQPVHRKTKRARLLFGSCRLSRQHLITSNQLLITYNKRDRGKHR